MSLLRCPKGEARKRNCDSYRQTGGRQPFRSVFSVLHFPALHFAVLQPLSPTTRIIFVLRIRCDILLQVQIIQQIEIRVHIVIIV